jgi:hypothetical protein
LEVGQLLNTVPLFTCTTRAAFLVQRDAIASIDPSWLKVRVSTGVVKLSKAFQGLGGEVEVGGPGNPPRPRLYRFTTPASDAHAKFVPSVAKAHVGRPPSLANLRTMELVVCPARKSHM